MLPKVQNALTLLFIIFFVNVAIVGYNVVNFYLSLNVMPAIHANTLGLINLIVAFLGIISMYVKSRQF